MVRCCKSEPVVDRKPRGLIWEIATECLLVRLRMVFSGWIWSFDANSEKCGLDLKLVRSMRTFREKADGPVIRKMCFIFGAVRETEIMMIEEPLGLGSNSWFFMLQRSSVILS